MLLLRKRGFGCQTQLLPVVQGLESAAGAEGPERCYIISAFPLCISGTAWPDSV